MRDLLRSGTFWFSVAVVVVLGVGAGLSVVFWGDLLELETTRRV